VCHLHGRELQSRSSVQMAHERLHESHSCNVASRWHDMLQPSSKWARERCLLSEAGGRDSAAGGGGGSSQGGGGGGSSRGGGGGGVSDIQAKQLLSSMDFGTVPLLGEERSHHGPAIGSELMSLAAEFASGDLAVLREHVSTIRYENKLQGLVIAELRHELRRPGSQGQSLRATPDRTGALVSEQVHTHLGSPSLGTSLCGIIVFGALHVVCCTPCRVVARPRRDGCPCRISGRSRSWSRRRCGCSSSRRSFVPFMSSCASERSNWKCNPGH
jgi:hypothetical protein